MDILSLRDVSKIYGELRALDQINLTAEKSEWVAIMGPSGGGKTTMMNIIGCIDKPSLGGVTLDGTDTAKRNQKELTEVRRDKIGPVSQQFHLVNYLTAFENVMMAQCYHSIPDKEEIMKALREVGFVDCAKHLPNQFSGDEQRHVCTARALVNYPASLLADEPTGNLDEKNEYSAMDIFEKLHSAGSSIVVVTHDPEVGDEAERMIVLEHGRIAREEKKKRQRSVTAEQRRKATMKRRIALLAALMLLSLAACGKKENVGSKTVESKTTESKTAQGYKDGTYSGRAEVKEVSGTIKLDVTVPGGKIATADMQNLDREGKEKGEDHGRSEPPNRGLYSIAQDSTLGTDKLPDLLVDSQDPDSIDVMSDATLSREAFVRAVRVVLDGAK